MLEEITAEEIIKQYEGRDEQTIQDPDFVEKEAE